MRRSYGKWVGTQSDRLRRNEEAAAQKYRQHDGGQRVLLGAERRNTVAQRVRGNPSDPRGQHVSLCLESPFRYGIVRSKAKRFEDYESLGGKVPIDLVVDPRVQGLLWRG